MWFIDGSCAIDPAKYRTEAAGGGDPPASNSNTLKNSDNLPASTHPADPAPTGMETTL